ncbi:hypothetical protein PZ894_10480 [Nocardioides sp. YIM 152315]|nr:hypothetical protein [Nocardioides sp. YIM 152315]
MSSVSNADEATSEFDQVVAEVAVVSDHSTLVLTFESDEPAHEVIDDLEAAGFDWAEADIVGDDLILDSSEDSASSSSAASLPTASKMVQLTEPPPAGSPPSPVYCNEDWTSGNPAGDGVFGTQRPCDRPGAAWYFKVGTATRSIAVGNVSERGLDWWRDGLKKTRQGYHPSVPVSYIFHGSFPGAAQSSISFNDVITGRHDVAGGGNFTVRYNGYLAYKGRRR